MIRRRRRTCLTLLLSISIFFYILARYLQSSSSSSSSPIHLTLFDQIHRDDNLYLPPNVCLTKNEKKNVRRAIIVYFPIERSDVFTPELKWLYLSWIEVIQNQPPDWQTDLLVYSLPSLVLDDLGCYENVSRSSGNNCLRRNYTSLWDRQENISELLRAIQDNVPSWCRHLNSLGIFLENPDLLNEYDYIMKTDLDVFLTPAFANYIPFDCSFQIGIGGYSHGFTTNKLSRIAQTLNLLDVNFKQVGSTWYGPPKQVVLVARTALWLSVWLSRNEFTVVEKYERYSILSWPQWYIGVVSMYASHLAINHYAGRGQIKLIQKPYLIDYSCTINSSFHEVEIIHIHSWHVRISLVVLLDFSKYFRRMDFFRNSYSKMVPMTTC